MILDDCTNQSIDGDMSGTEEKLLDKTEPNGISEIGWT